MDLAPDVTPEDLEVFLQEADEQLRLLDEDVVRLEREPDAGELLQEIFRAAHTLKGSSGMLGYKEMAELAHHMEHLLDLFRTGALAVTTPAVDALLHSLDAMRVLRDELADPTGRSLDVSAAMAELAQAAGASAEGEPGAKDAGSAPAGAGPAAPIVLGPAARERIADLASGDAQLLAVDVHISADTIWSSVRLFQALQALGDLGEVIASEPSQSAIDSGAPSQLLRAIVSTRSSEDDVRREVGGLDDIAGVEVEPYVPEAVAKDAPDAAGAGQRRTGAGRTQTVRIDVARLDELMNQIGELVIDRTRIVQIGKALEQRYKGDDMVEALGETSAHIVKVVDELQESTRQVRMQPIGTVFSGLPRMVRDLSHKMGKKLDFQVSGSETEIDRTVIERIRDPLIHLLRNAVDHGVELPEERIAAGKPETAVLKLRAYQEQGHIVIVVEDDGRGIDTERVKAAAVKKGLISAEAGARLTEAQAIELIFLPGASTAVKTTGDQRLGDRRDGPGPEHPHDAEASADPGDAPRAARACRHDPLRDTARLRLGDHGAQRRRDTDDRRAGGDTRARCRRAAHIALRGVRLEPGGARRRQRAPGRRGTSRRAALGVVGGCLLGVTGDRGQAARWVLG